MRRETDRAVYGHIVKPLTTSRQPWTWLVVDSEAWREQLSPSTERQSFACAVAVLMRRREESRTTWRPDVWEAFTDPGALWAWCAARCPRRSRTVLVAHNLAYDLRITHAFGALTALDWRLENFGIDQGSVWLVWRGPNDRTLVMVDSMAWWQTGLDKLGAALGVPKLELPPPDAPVEELLTRCRRDVEILAGAWRTLLDWLASEQLGPWRMSGASQSWAAWRRRFYPDVPLFVRDPDNLSGIRDFERRSAWTGRTEAWRTGMHHGVHEWDFAHAYASVARDCELPREQIAYVDQLTLSKWQQVRDGGYAVLSVCDVATSEPVVPAQGPDGICWPVGTFRTVLWDNEVAELLAAGGNVRLWHSSYYERAPIMASMARWLCDQLDGRTTLPPVLGPVVKHWARTLVGRSAMSFPTWRVHIDLAPDELTDVYRPYELATRGEDGIRRTLRVGNQVFADVGDKEPSDAAPFVQSYVMAEARCRLWRAMNVAGLDHVLYVDTDSVIVDGTGQWRLARAHITDLRHKGELAHVEVLGPRQLYVDGRLRMAGLPGARDARRVRRGVYDVTVWPSLVGSLEAGEHETVTVRRQRVTVNGVDHRRLHRRDGSTTPLVLSEAL